MSVGQRVRFWGNPEATGTAEVLTELRDVWAVHLDPSGHWVVATYRTTGQRLLVAVGVGTEVSSISIDNEDPDDPDQESDARPQWMGVLNLGTSLDPVPAGGDAWYEPCGCLRNRAGDHRWGCPDHPEGDRGDS